MLPGPKRWDVPLLEDMFNCRDRDLILRIPLNHTQQVDNLIWAPEISGIYSVRSAYKLIQEDRGVWRQEEEQWLWQKLWKLKIPPKIKNMVWRACSECLPTKILLQQKKVHVDSLCPVCSQDDETILHCLVECPSAQMVWQRVGIGSEYRESVSFRTWFEKEFRSLCTEKRGVLATVCWAIWGARNDKVWNNKLVSPTVIINNATSYLAQWKEAQVSSAEGMSSGLTPLDGASVWIPPLGDTLKVNVDGATFEGLNGFGLGIVVRDCTGSLVVGRTKFFNGRAAPEVVEALGIHEALSWIKEMNWHDITIESDSLVAIQALRCSIIMRSWFGNIIGDCKNLLNDLSSLNVVFVRRSANAVAHRFARASDSYPDCTFDLGNIPIALLSSLVTAVVA